MSSVKMTEYAEISYDKVPDAVRCLLKALSCTLCLKLPTETVAAKCGHPFCDACVNKILNTKKSVCTICKTVLTRSSLHRVKHVDKIAEDLKNVCAAVQKDANISVSLTNAAQIRQYPGKLRSLTLPGPSGSKMGGETSDGESRGRSRRGKRVERGGSIESEETIQLRESKKLGKRREGLPTETASTSRTINNEPVFAADSLSVKIGTIGFKEKVQGWLNAEEFEGEPEDEAELIEAAETQTSISNTASETLESFSQALPNSAAAAAGSVKNGRNSRASKTSKKSERGSTSTVVDSGSRFKSFKLKQSVPKPVTQAEKMFDELRIKTSQESNENKKSRVRSLSNEDSWSDLALLKKETRTKGRKRKRLNISFERPSSSKQAVGTEEINELGDNDGVENTTDKNERLIEETAITPESVEKRKMRNLIVSSKILGDGEMIDIQRLNKRQVKDIIGVACSEGNLDDSKNSSTSLDRSNRNKLSLSKSGEHSRDRSNEEETSSRLEESSRPQSKQSSHPNDSRPGSRLSHKSTDKPVAERFRLSTKRKSSSPSPLPIHVNQSPLQPKEEQRKIEISHDSPIRPCNDFMRSKLSLKKLSPGSSRMTDHENKGSVIVSIKKLGKLFKTRNRIKFLRLGALARRNDKIEMSPKSTNFSASHCDAQTQTSPRLTRSNSLQENVCRRISSTESLTRVVVPETRTASAASSDSKQTGKAPIAVASTSRITESNKSPDEFDSGNKVNMLSPDKDSQLKYLATKSPSVPRIGLLDSDQSLRKPCNSYAVMRETSFTNSGHVVLAPGLDTDSRKVKKYAEKLIVTDSEDQDTPNENLERIKRRNNHEAENNRSEKETPSATTPFGFKSASRMDEEIRAKRSLSNIAGNNLAGESSHASPKRKRHLRDSTGSQSKRRSAEKLRSQSHVSGSLHRNSSSSDAETVLLNKTKSKEDSEASLMTAKHKVVRKLKYNQEFGSNPKTDNGKSESSEKQAALDKEKRGNHSTEKRTFQRIRRISSTDSENDLLMISMSTKQSSSNSQTVPRTGLSREADKSPILSEDMTVVFSSNKDTQESKRKRSPSPSPLDNNDLQAIASNWCADLNHSSEEVAIDNAVVFGMGKKGDTAPPKKPKVELQSSPGSFNSDKFPALSPTAIYGNRRNRNNATETIAQANSQSLDNEASELIANLEDAAAHFDDVNSQVRTERSGNGNKVVSTNNTRHIYLATNIECSINRGNTFNGIGTTSRSSTPIKAKSLEDATQKLSHNSDKENELVNRSVKNRAQSKESSAKTAGQKITTNEHPNKLQVNYKYHAQPLDSSFDRDCLNITQEELMMQEVENNLLGRKSTAAIKSGEQTRRDENAGKTSAETNPSINYVDRKPPGYRVAEIHTDDSETLDEDIVESTPEKNIPAKKDSYSHADNSQQFNTSLKSFMSVDITPIAKTVPKPFQKISSARSSNHSTPKAASSFAHLPRKSGSVEARENKERRLCFVCSSLTLQQIHNVKAFARKHNAEYTVDFIPQVTHVIVETDERDSASRTLKYLLGVAHKKWILSYRWVTDSLSQGRLLEEEDYEVLDSENEEPGPRRSRLSKEGLFDTFAFACIKPFPDITIDQLQDLLTSTGGTVVQTLEDLASVTNKLKMILYSSNVYEPVVLENWRRRGAALPVQVEWVLSCISQYELVSFRSYLQSIDPQVALEYGFSTGFIREEEENSSANEADT